MIKWSRNGVGLISEDKNMLISPLPIDITFASNPKPYYRLRIRSESTIVESQTIGELVKIANEHYEEKG